MAASWLIGSNPTIGACQVTVTANATQEQLTILSASRGVYLYNGGSGSFDALALLETALESHSQITTATAVIRRNRLTAVTCDVAWEVDSWDGAGGAAFQALLGFAGEEQVASATTQVSAVQSAYLWSPGFTESTPIARLGETGVPYYDTAVGQSGNRVIVATQNNSGKVNEFFWPNVDNDRVWTSGEDTEEYYSFWDTVIRQFRQFKLWQSVNEDTSSSSAATYGSPLGPYKYRWDGSSPIMFPYMRSVPFLEKIHPVRLPVVLVDEYTT